MRISKFVSHWDNCEAENRSLKLTILILAITVVVQSVYLFRTVLDERIVLVPADLRDQVWVSGSNVSSEYLETLALNALPYYASFTPQTINEGHHVFLRYVHPDVYGPMSTELSGEARMVQRDNVSQAFWPERTEVKRSLRTVVVEGIQKRMIGSVVSYEGPARFTVQFIQQGPRIWIKGITHETS